MFKEHLWIIPLLMLLLLGANAHAQNESGRRPMNKNAWKSDRSWYDSTTSTAEVQYPIIRSLPPVNSGMPWDILATYIYMDSLARFDKAHTMEIALTQWAAQGLMNDTLKWMVKYLYKVKDYDPIIFRQYCDETALKAPAKYAVSLNNVTGLVEQAYAVSQRNDQDMRAIYSMLTSDYILRVRVTGVDSVALKYPIPNSTHIFRVHAEVVDTLKGRVFSICTDQSNAGSGVRHPASPITIGGWNTCITFNYEHINYPDPYQFSSEPSLYHARDPEFARPIDSGFTMRAGQEAIVFLVHHDPLKDSTNDYYNLALQSAAWNALPILGESVRDVNRIWTTATLSSYEEWKQRFYALRDKIMNGTY